MKRRGFSRRRVLLGVTGLTCAALAASAAFAAAGNAAAFPGENGRIAFQSHRSGVNWEIYSMRADGTDQTRLTNNDVYDAQPAISPDGRKIAFIRAVGGPGPSDGGPAGRFGSLWVMNSDGSNPRQITDRKSRTPAFSPDGNRITFTSVSDSGCFGGLSWENIFVIEISTTATQKLTALCDRAFNPTFTPDGSKILFQGKSFKDDLFGKDGLLWVNSTLRQPSSSPGTLGSWTPGREEMKGFSLSSNGNQWAYSMRQHPGGFGEWSDPSIYVSKAGGVPAPPPWDLIGRRIDRVAADDDVRPSFAPDGNAIAFERRPETADTDIYRVSPKFPAPEIKRLTVNQGKNMAPDWGPKPKP